MDDVRRQALKNLLKMLRSKRFQELKKKHKVKVKPEKTEAE